MDPFDLDDVPDAPALDSQFVTWPGSSNVRAGQYWPADKRLIITFAGGGSYEYEDVPATVWGLLLDAPSVGAVFQDRIRNGPFKFRRLDDYEPDLSTAEIRKMPEQRCPVCKSGALVRTAGGFSCATCSASFDLHLRRSSPAPLRRPRRPVKKAGR